MENSFSTCQKKKKKKKREKEAYEKIIEMSNNNNYTTGNFLDFPYFKKNYKLIATDLSKPTKLKDPQQISFIVLLVSF